MFKGIGDLIGQAQKMGQEMKQIQESLKSKTVEASSGGGMVKVKASGAQEILSITLESELMKLNDKEMVQDLVRAGVNQALKASKDLAQEEMQKLTGGIGPLASMLKGVGG